MLIQFAQGLVQSEEVKGLVVASKRLFVEFDTTHFRSTLQARVATSTLHENPSHGFCCCRKEMAAGIPMLRLLDIHEPDVCVVHQGRGLQRLPRSFLRQLGGGQLSELVIHQRQQLLRRRWIAGFDLRQNAGDVGHGHGTREMDEARDYNVAFPRQPSKFRLSHVSGNRSKKPCKKRVFATGFERTHFGRSRRGPHPSPSRCPDQVEGGANQHAADLST